MNDLLNLIYLLLFLLAGLCIYTIQNQQFLSINTSRNIGFCGVVSFEGYSKSNYNSIVAGKSLFKNSCATCHAKNMMSPLTGPPLKDVDKFWSDDSLEVEYYLSGVDSLMNDRNYNRIIYLRKEYGFKENVHRVKLKSDEVNAVFHYIDFMSE